MLSPTTKCARTVGGTIKDHGQVVYSGMVYSKFHVEQIPFANVIVEIEEMMELCPTSPIDGSREGHETLLKEKWEGLL